MSERRPCPSHAVAPRLDRGAYRTGTGHRVPAHSVGPPPKAGDDEIAGSPQRGAALLAVLWFVAAVSALAITFSRLATADRVTVVTQADAVRARALARDGLARALLALQERGPERPLPRSLTWSLPGGEVVAARLEAEAGKVDLNAAEPPLIEALARAAGVPRERAELIAAAVVDWRDADESRQVKGAERREYESQDRPYAPANRPLRGVAELRYVLPVDNDAYARMAPHLTVHGGRARPEARLASPIVRAALGLRRNAERSGGDGEAAGPRAEDDAPAKRVAGGPPAGPTRTPQPASDPEAAEGDGEGGGAGGGRGAVYTVRLDVRLPEGYETHARAVVALAPPDGAGNRPDGGGGDGGAPVRVLDWAAAEAPPPPQPAPAAAEP